MVQKLLFEDRIREKAQNIIKENTKYFLEHTENKEGFVNFLKLIQQVKKFIEENRKEDFVLVHDRDADGQTSGGIMYYLLNNHLDINVDVVNTNRSDFDKIAEEYGRDKIYVFTDVGSGQTDLIKEADIDLERTIIFDHHLKLIDTYAKYEVNPNFFGFSGSFEISGAGTVYMLVREFGLAELSQLAVVGACGDMQNTFYGLRGLNRLILRDGVRSGFINIIKGLPIFGRETRPLFKSLFLMTEPRLFKSDKQVYAFLFDKDIPYEYVKEPLNVVYREMVNGKQLEQLLIEEIYKEFMKKAPITLKPFSSIYVIGENYELNSFPRGTPLHDSKEFATMLNAMNRLDKIEEVGIKLTTMRHSKVLPQAISIQRKARRELAKSINAILDQLDVRKRTYRFMVVLNETDLVSPHNTGTILQMLIDTLTPLYNKPLVGFTYSSDDEIKVSLRESKILYLSDVNLAVAVERASEKVGGIGGGHPVACGAKIPASRLDDFLEILHKELIKEGIRKGFII